MDGRLIGLQNGRLRVIAQPDLGGGLTRFDAWLNGQWRPVFRGLDGVAQDPDELALYPLIPWCNRLYGGEFAWGAHPLRVPPNRAGEADPLHGQGWLQAWTVEARTLGQIVLEWDARDRHPWSYKARLHYRIEPDALVVELEARNMGDSPFPFGLGLHPWFVRTGDVELEFNSTGRWEPDATRMPRQLLRPAQGGYPVFGSARRLPGEHIDHVYEGWDGRAFVRWPSTGLQLEMRSITPGAYLTVYSHVSGSEVDFFCVEPITHRPGAHAETAGLGHGLVALQPGGVIRQRVRFSVSALA